VPRCRDVLQRCKSALRLLSMASKTPAPGDER
jgi:hypothetical protein